MVDDLGIPGLEGAEWVGRGSFGIVYRASEPQFGWRVAVKILNVVLDDEALLLFEREQKTLGSVSGHPNIIRLLDAGITEHQRPYLKMEYLSGGSLAAAIRRAPMPLDQVIDTGVKMCGALARAHEMNVLHRDIKPENILRSEFGEPKLADFGVAKFQEAAVTASTVIGSPAFASPEAISGEPATCESDVWSLGATLRTLLSGRPPFAGTGQDSLFALMRRIINDPPADLRAFDVPAAVIEVLDKAMAKDPQDRYGSAVDFGRALQAAQRSVGCDVTPLVLPDAAPTDPGGRDEADPEVEMTSFPQAVAELVDPDRFLATPPRRPADVPAPDPAPDRDRPRLGRISRRRHEPATDASTPGDLTPAERAKQDAAMRAFVLDLDDHRQREADRRDEARREEIDAGRAMAAELIRDLSPEADPDDVPVAPAAEPANGDSDGDASPTESSDTVDSIVAPSESVTAMLPSSNGEVDESSEPIPVAPIGGSDPSLEVTQLRPLSPPNPRVPHTGAEGTAPSNSSSVGQPAVIHPRSPSPGTDRRFVVTRPTPEPVRVEVLDSHHEVRDPLGASIMVGDRGLRARLVEPDVRVDPGRVASTTITVANAGFLLEQIDLELTGLPAEWVDIAPASLTLASGAEAAVTVSFAPPRTSDAAAGTYSYGLVTWSRANPQVRCEERGSVEVLPFHRLLAVLDPPASRGRSGAVHTLTVTNEGNATATTPVQASGPPGLRLSCQPSHLTILPGASARSDVHVEALVKKAIGRAQAHSFTVSLEDMDGPVPLHATFTRGGVGRSG